MNEHPIYDNNFAPMPIATLLDGKHHFVIPSFQRCLDILIKTGLATPTVPDKPNSRFQKYVLTEKGKSIIESVNKQKEPRPNSFQRDI